MTRSSRDGIRPPKILKATLYLPVFAVMCFTSLSTYSAETPQLALAIASSAGKAKVCRFSEQTGIDAFENIGLIVGCRVASGELTDAQADNLLLEAANLYHASRDEETAPPEQVCDAMRNLIEKFAKVQAC